ncbi:hypothetical protein OAH23_05100 [Verrucomicrobia bacterium]|nr:hypothetical protein [Verrucomicrobiota bacterium]
MEATVVASIFFEKMHQKPITFVEEFRAFGRFMRKIGMRPVGEENFRGRTKVNSSLGGTSKRDRKAPSIDPSMAMSKSLSGNDHNRG